MVADVVVENASYSFDIPFSYRVPGRMEGQIRPGCRVLVPFGRSNRSKQGLVLHLQPQDPQSQQLKPIKMLLDQNRCWVKNSCGCWSCCISALFAPTMKGCGRWCPAG